MHTPGGEALTGIILAIFRANGLLLQAGDRLVADLDLTSARWQVLGAVALAAGPVTVPQIAAFMGVTRQGAQKQVDALLDRGLLEDLPNPAHKRSPLLRLTHKGDAAYRAASRIQEKWANTLAAGIPPRELEAAQRALQSLSGQLEQTVERSRR